MDEKRDVVELSREEYETLLKRAGEGSLMTIAEWVRRKCYVPKQAGTPLFVNKEGNGLTTEPPTQLENQDSIATISEWVRSPRFNSNTENPVELKKQVDWLLENRQILVSDFNTERKNLTTKIECLTDENVGLVNQLNDAVAECEGVREEMYDLAEYVHNPCGSCSVEKSLDVEIRHSNILKREVEMYREYSEGLKYQIMNEGN
jgi:hypothetical protein